MPGPEVQEVSFAAVRGFSLQVPGSQLRPVGTPRVRVAHQTPPTRPVSRWGTRPSDTAASTPSWWRWCWPCSRLWRITSCGWRPDLSSRTWRWRSSGTVRPSGSRRRSWVAYCSRSSASCRLGPQATRVPNRLARPWTPGVMSEVGSRSKQTGRLARCSTKRVILKIQLSAMTCPTVGLTSRPYTTWASGTTTPTKETNTTRTRTPWWGWGTGSRAPITGIYWVLCQELCVLIDSSQPHGVGAIVPCRWGGGHRKVDKLGLVSPPVLALIYWESLWSLW